MTDIDYRVMVVNPMVREVLNLTDNGEITIFDLISKLEKVFPLREKLEESMKLEKTITIPEVVIRDTYYGITVAPVRNQTGIHMGEVLGGVVLFHDITQDKELEHIRDEFTAMMVHELRSPLGNIRKLSETLQNPSIWEESVKRNKYIQLIYENSSHMLELVNDLLDVAKIESGTFTVDPRPTDVRNLIEDRLAFYTATASNKDIVLTHQIAASVPDRWNMDEKRIGQAINNYLSNAIKFTQEGGEVRVQVTIHQQGSPISVETNSQGMSWFINDNELSADTPDAMIIAVTDTGIGVIEEDRSTLFNKFKQVQGLDNDVQQQGTGLGLSIVKGIVEAHGGTVGVASVQGEGSTFYMVLPEVSKKQ